MEEGKDRESSGDSVEVLLVEDNPGDVELTQRILSESKFSLNINVVHDGEEAMAYLHRKDRFEGSSRPDLLLLDLKMPKKDGYEVVAEMQRDANLSSIPVMVLTSTAAEEDIVFDMGVHPSRFCRKPLDLSQFDSVVDNLKTGGAAAVAQPTPQQVDATEQTKRRWWSFGR